MPPGLSTRDFYYILPELVLTGGALLVLVADVLLPRRSHVALAWATLAVIAATLAALIPFIHEPAREIAIRAHLLAGETSAAMRHYRQYRETLLAELQCEPSEHIQSLVGLAVSTEARVATGGAISLAAAAGLAVSLVALPLRHRLAASAA